MLSAALSGLAGRRAALRQPGEACCCSAARVDGASAASRPARMAVRCGCDFGHACSVGAGAGLSWLAASPERQFFPLAEKAAAEGFGASQFFTVL